MIKKFSVQNFKNFKEKITIDFSNVRDYCFNDYLIKNGLINKAFILGKNNSGKSNFGAAIMDITRHLTNNNSNHFIYNVYTNGFSVEDFSTFYYHFIFDDTSVEYLYKKGINGQLLYEKLIINSDIVFEYNYINKFFTNSIYEGNTVDISKNNNPYLSVLKYIYTNTLYWSSNNPFKIFMEFVDHMLWFRSLRENEFLGLLPNGEDLSDFIINNKLINKFEDFLNDCGQKFKITTFFEPGLGKNVLAVEYNRFVQPFAAIASTGTLTLWVLFYWLNRTNDISFMYLDEFDAFYHYDLSKYILSLLLKKECQVVVTSHNTKLVDNSLMRPDCYLFLKNEKLISFSDSSISKIRKDNKLEKILIENKLDF